MTTITPAEAQQHIDRAFVLDSLAATYTAWGDEAWNDGRIRDAVRHWMTAAQYSMAAKREGGEH